MAVVVVTVTVLWLSDGFGSLLLTDKHPASRSGSNSTKGSDACEILPKNKRKQLLRFLCDPFAHERQYGRHDDRSDKQADEAKRLDAAQGSHQRPEEWQPR